jgi:hypothetical protein
MTPDTGFTFQDAMGEICKGVIDTVGERPGESGARRMVRQRTVALTMMSFLPRDTLETLLAGQCVIFDNLMHDGARVSLRGPPENMRLRACAQIHVSAKMFLAHLNKFQELQDRQADKLAFQPEARAAAAEPAPESAPPPTPAPTPIPSGPRGDAPPVHATQAPNRTAPVAAQAGAPREVHVREPHVQAASAQRASPPAAGPGASQPATQQVPMSVQKPAAPGAVAPPRAHPEPPPDLPKPVIPQLSQAEFELALSQMSRDQAAPADEADTLSGSRVAPPPSPQPGVQTGRPLRDSQTPREKELV